MTTVLPGAIAPATSSAWGAQSIRNLRAHVDRFAETMPRDAAVAWVYATVLVAWAEDHRLVCPWLRAAATHAQETWLAAGATGGMRGWLARAIASLAVHPGTWTLLDPDWTPLHGSYPSEDACRELVAWWAAAPSFACSTGGGPATIAGWEPGDLLQHLSEECRKRHALVQTPWWVCDFILDLTLLPACAEFTGETLRVIDPACGTGHFIIRAIDYLWEWYTTGSVAPRQAKTATVAGGTPLPPDEAIRRILTGLHGCDIDPLTAAVARFRYTVAIGSLMCQAGLIPGPLRLDRIPPFQVPVIPADSLLANLPGFTAEQYADLHPKLAKIVNLNAPAA